MAFDAILFDLDGTLIDSAPDVRWSVNQCLSDHARWALSPAEATGMIGWGARVLLQRAFAMTGAPLADAAVDAAVAGFQAYYRQRPAADTIVYPGVVETLEQFKQSGLPMGVVTNKPHEMSLLVLEALGLMPYFSAVIGGDKARFPKPDGRHLLDTIKQMGVNGGRIVMVGDSETDCAAGRSAGVAVVAVTYGYMHGGIEALDADVLIDNFADLPMALEQLLG